jgi:hypothetical protein
VSVERDFFLEEEGVNLLAVDIVVEAFNQDMVLVVNCWASEVAARICFNVDPVGKGI